MQKSWTVLLSLAALVWVASSLSTMAAEEEKTIVGEGKCGKCALKETKSCQNVIEVKEGDKKVKYYLVANEESKNFHKNICTETKKVKAVGKVKEVDGKKEFTAKKIELVKE